MLELSQPSVDGHGPVGASHLHDDRHVGDQLGQDLGLGTDHRVHDVGTLLVERDPGARKLVLSVLFLPHQGVDPVILLHPHLVHGGGVTVGGVLKVLGHHTQQIEDPANRHDLVRDIDAEWAVHAAAPTRPAVDEGDAGGVPDEIPVHLALAAHHLPQGVLDLGHRRIIRVTIARQVALACLRAQATVHTGVEIDLEPGG